MILSILILLQLQPDFNPYHVEVIIQNDRAQVRWEEIPGADRYIVLLHGYRNGRYLGMRLPTKTAYFAIHGDWKDGRYIMKEFPGDGDYWQVQLVYARGSIQDTLDRVTITPEILTTHKE